MTPATQRLVLTIVVMVAATGCGKRTIVAKATAPTPPAANAQPSRGKPPVPPPTSPDTRAASSSQQRQQQGLAPTIAELYGLASWYGYPYHGRKTASGEVYDMNQLTAAHKTLPLGTHVEVTNQTNGQQVEVRINDRGPFVEGRVIDLSYAAAKQILMVGPGMALVSLKLLESPATSVGSPTTRFGVQVGAFREKDNATRLQSTIAQRHAPVVIAQTGDAALYRVLVGAEQSESAAQALASQLHRENLYGKVVMLP